MKIIHLSNTPLSNSPANLAQIQNDAGHEAIVLLNQQSNKNKVFVGGTLWSTYSAEELEALFTEADIIHMHNFAWSQMIFACHPHLIGIAKSKKCLIQYHSPRDSHESFEDTISNPFFKGRRAVVAQYQVRQYPEAEFIVPNVLPLHDDVFKPVERDWNNQVISFAPSNVNLRGWDDKGYSQVQPILWRIAQQHRAITEVIVNTPYEETLIRKKWATIGMEELVTGSYHLSMLEYMAMGCATLQHG